LSEYWIDSEDQGLFIETKEQFYEKNKKVTKIARAIKKLEKKDTKFIPFSCRTLRRRYLKKVHPHPTVREDLDTSATKFEILTLEKIR